MENRRGIWLSILLCLVSGLLAGCRPANPLVGTSWTLVSLNDHEVIPGTTTTAAFKKKGLPRPGIAIFGTAGCNCYSSPVEINDDSIAFGDDKYGTIGVVYNLLCVDEDLQEDQDLMAQEEEYTQILFNIVQYYSLANERLFLKDKNGKVVLIFQKGLPANENRSCIK